MISFLRNTAATALTPEVRRRKKGNFDVTGMGERNQETGIRAMQKAQTKSQRDCVHIL